MEAIREKVICLGKEFYSEEERREFFRDELRKKLPELKKIEGFPVGEDEDIITLSDPPYYTACPNPWLNDFIAGWEMEKETVEGRKKNADVDQPFAGDISEGKNNAIYTAHTYHTKVPHIAIMRYLLHYTQPGDIVLDAFCGTGMTGVASQCCVSPDDETKAILDAEWKSIFGFSPNWGKRNTILGDLSPLATFIAYNYNMPFDAQEFDIKLQSVLEEVRTEIEWMYRTKHTNGKIGLINYTVWSEVLICKTCGEEYIFWNQAIDDKKAQMNESFPCPSCKSVQTKESADPAFYTLFDTGTNSTIRQKKFEPVLIHYTYSRKNYLKKPDEHDLANIEKIEEKQRYWIPTDRMPEGDESRRNDRSGVTHSHHFYTKRSLAALSVLYAKLPVEYRVIFTSMLNRCSRLVKTLISNYLAQVRGKSVGGWAGTPLTGTLYLPSISTEISILESAFSRFNSLLKLQLAKKSFYTDNFCITTGSATKIELAENSVDYIFTDPPFGANIMYSELNFITESWLRVKTNNKTEAIQNRSQGKSLLEYQNLMTKSFSEYFRVLRPGKWMTVEFSNTSAAVWNGIQIALQRAGFVIANVAALDKKQGSFKAVTTPTAVKQDLVISCYKPSREFESKFIIEKGSVLVWEFVAEHLRHLPIHISNGIDTTSIVERNPKILYDRLITYYLMRGVSIPIDAKDFHEGLRQKFIERDGMYFTAEQAVVYDEKKAKTPKVVQLTLMVSTESDAIEWIKDRLQKKSAKYQDLMPEFRRATQSLRKGDTLPELQDILNENFIEEADGKWRNPNPDEAKDREALRTKVLIKEFNSYLDLLNQPKVKKMKEVRVEALRAGFKLCWEKKDFKIIVTMGDVIPQNILLEDEQLLMYYDIAKDRI
jgi:DNA modification methylase